MDNKLCMELMMMNESRRKAIERIAFMIISASAVYGKSQDEILDITNILIKEELEKWKGSAENLEKNIKQVKKELKDKYGMDLDKL